MTRDEMDRLDAISSELKSDIKALSAKIETYHTENREQIVSCKACRTTVAGVAHVVYGNGEPGLKGDVQSLKESRNHMRAGIAAAWSAIVAIVCAALKWVAG